MTDLPDVYEPANLKYDRSYAGGAWGVTRGGRHIGWVYHGSQEDDEMNRWGTDPYRGGAGSEPRRHTPNESNEPEEAGQCKDCGYSVDNPKTHHFGGERGDPYPFDSREAGVHHLIDEDNRAIGEFGTKESRERQAQTFRSHGAQRAVAEREQLERGREIQRHQETELQRKLGYGKNPPPRTI